MKTKPITYQQDNLANLKSNCVITFDIQLKPVLYSDAKNVSIGFEIHNVFKLMLIGMMAIQNMELLTSLRKMSTFF